MNVRTKKVLRIAAVPFSLVLIGGYVAFRASGGLAFGTKAESAAAIVAPDAAAEPDPMMFSGSKSGPIFTPPPKENPKEMFVGSKSGGISRPEDFAPPDPFKLPPVPATQPKPPAKPAQQPAKPQSK